MNLFTLLALQYYRDHLELFNEEFRNQVNEFRDGNLFSKSCKERYGAVCKLILLH